MDSFVLELGEKRKECVYYDFSLSLLGEEDRNYEFICKGIGGGRREKSVYVYYDFSLSWERRIEIMNSFVWEWGEKRKDCVFIMISLLLLGEEDRNYEFVCVGVGGRREKSVYLL